MSVNMNARSTVTALHALALRITGEGASARTDWSSPSKRFARPSTTVTAPLPSFEAPLQPMPVPRSVWCSPGTSRTRPLPELGRLLQLWPDDHPRRAEAVDAHAEGL